MQNHSTKRFDVPDVVGRIGVTIFALVFLVAGCFFLVALSMDFWQRLQVRSWQPSQCRIISSEITEKVNNDPPYEFQVRYSYNYNNKRYIGSRFSITSTSSSDYQTLQELDNLYKPGAVVSCLINSTRPEQAMITSPSLMIGLAVVMPIFFITLALILLYHTWRRVPRIATESISAEIPTTSQARRSHKHIIFWSVASLMAVVGSYFTWQLTQEWRDIQSWQPHQCKIVSSKVNGRQRRGGKIRNGRRHIEIMYSVDIHFEYEWQGQRYRSNRFSLTKSASSNRASQERVTKEYSPGKLVHCFVNPRNPQQALLQRGFPISLLLGFLPLGILLYGICSLVLKLRRVTTNNSGQLVTGNAKPTPDSEKAGHDGSPASGSILQLKPRMSPIVKAGVILFGALFWNVGVYFLAYQHWDNYQSLPQPWLAVVLLAILALIGLLLLVATPYFLLALANPRPILSINQPSLKIGGQATLSWQFTGRAERINRLIITLSASEKIWYRRGTKTIRETNEFYSQELVNVTGMFGITQGSVELTLPVTTMHSFEAEHNAIVWQLKLTGEIDKWPDVNEKYTITLLPTERDYQDDSNT